MKKKICNIINKLYSIKERILSKIFIYYFILFHIELSKFKYKFFKIILLFVRKFVKIISYFLSYFLIKWLFLIIMVILLGIFWVDYDIFLNRIIFILILTVITVFLKEWLKFCESISNSKKLIKFLKVFNVYILWLHLRNFIGIKFLNIRYYLYDKQIILNKIENFLIWIFGWFDEILRRIVYFYLKIKVKLIKESYKDMVTSKLILIIILLLLKGLITLWKIILLIFFIKLFWFKFRSFVYEERKNLLINYKRKGFVNLDNIEKTDFITYKIYNSSVILKKYWIPKESNLYKQTFILWKEFRYKEEWYFFNKKLRQKDVKNGIPLLYLSEYVEILQSVINLYILLEYESEVSVKLKLKKKVMELFFLCRNILDVLKNEVLGQKIYLVGNYLSLNSNYNITFSVKNINLNLNNLSKNFELKCNLLKNKWVLFFLINKFYEKKKYYIKVKKLFFEKLKNDKDLQLNFLNKDNKLLLNLTKKLFKGNTKNVIYKIKKIKKKGSLI